jgi:hypothetical protein
MRIVVYLPIPIDFHIIDCLYLFMQKMKLTKLIVNIDHAAIFIYDVIGFRIAFMVLILMKLIVLTV